MKINKIIINIVMRGKSRNNKGFTLGLAVIILASMLLLSITISSLLIRDIKNSISNTKSVIAYQTAESLLSCALSHDANIRYFTGTNASDIQELSGIYPKNLKIFDQTPLLGTASVVPYSTAAYDPLADIFTPGYADKNYEFTGAANKLYTRDSIKCFNISIFRNINAGLTNTTVTYYDPVNVTSPNLLPYKFGVKTETVFSESDIENYLGIKNVCATLSVHGKDGVGTKFFIARAETPCGSSEAVERVLVQYSN